MIAKASQWKGGIVGYAVNYLARNAWRVRGEMELDDMLQSAYLLFVKLQCRYPDASPQEFMGLWKASLRNWLNNMAFSAGAVARRRTRTDGVEDAWEYDQGIADLEWRWQEEEAPPEVVKLLDAVADRKRSQKHLPVFESGKRETTNEFLCRLAKLPSSIPLRAMFESWLLGREK